MKKSELKKLFVDIASEYETCEEIIDCLRSLNSNKEITKSNYDYILKHFDELLNEIESLDEKCPFCGSYEYDCYHEESEDLCFIRKCECLNCDKKFIIEYDLKVKNIIKNK